MSSSARPPRSESSVPAEIALIVTLALFAIPPDGRLLLARAIVAGALALASIPLILQNPVRLSRWADWSRPLATVVATVLVVADLASIAELIVTFGDAATNGLALAILGVVPVAIVHVLSFALLFWVMDSGGPVRRRHHQTRLLPEADFAFWSPLRSTAQMPAKTFGEYLRLSLRNAVAVTRSRTRPATRRAAVLMAAQTLSSFALLVVVLVRVIGVLRG